MTNRFPDYDYFSPFHIGWTNQDRFEETLDAQCCSSCGKMHSNALCVCCRTARAGVGVSPGIVTETVKTD